MISALSRAFRQLSDPAFRRVFGLSVAASLAVFLAGFTQGRPLYECGRMGTIAAAEVISHIGARPETDLTALVRQRLHEA